ncbi:centrosomal protein POC5-like isoform X2 [Sycon ciliatum]|uniref:centrosomal protein POC5-like isoform X2 n=1 Tax=Sycon ciliatum TaxID=27933 RepID=UPI0031F689B4
MSQEPASEDLFVATPPLGTFDSPGSDSIVSSGLKQEYEELISHAIVVPNILLQTRQPVQSLEESVRRELAASRQRGSTHQAASTGSPLSLAQEIHTLSESESSSSTSSVEWANVPTASTGPQTSTLRTNGHPGGDRRQLLQQQRQQDVSDHSSNTSSCSTSSLDLMPNHTHNNIPTLAGNRPTQQQQQQQQQQHTMYTRVDYQELPRSPVGGIRPDITASGVATTASGIHTIRETRPSSGHDEDAERLEGQIDAMTNDLKQCILAEFAQAKAKYLQKSRLESGAERERHAAKVSRLRHEMEELRQLTSTLEDSLKHKDQVIENLTQSLKKQADQLQLQKSFGQWQANHSSTKREEFTAKLATRHYKKCLKRKVYNAWRSVLVQRWKQHVEKACQAKATSVCKELAEKYEEELRQAHELLDAERGCVQKLHEERGEYEARMKRAFMRGVCALNMETMDMFKPEGSTNAGL